MRRPERWAGAALAAIVAGTAVAADKGPVGLVIVYLGGPDAGGEGKKLAGQLVEHMAKATGLDATGFEGAYFTDTDAAVAHLKAHPDAFVLGGLGFYLSQRKALKLVPLAKVRTGAEASERYYVVVKKGKAKGLDELKGKTLWGSPLYEDPRYLDVFAFGGKLTAATYFAVKPTNRPLTAVRKLDKDEADAVLLTRAQYESLGKTPAGEKVESIYASDPVPSLGLMMVDSPRATAAKESVLKAVTAMCGGEDTKTICANFGIGGFELVAAGAFDDAIKRYESPRK